MPATPRTFISFPKSLVEAVEAYQAEAGHQSRSAAIVALLDLGLRAANHPPPPPRKLIPYAGYDDRRVRP